MRFIFAGWITGLVVAATIDRSIVGRIREYWGARRNRRHPDEGTRASYAHARTVARQISYRSFPRTRPRVKAEDVPILAWKVAYLICEDGHWRFAPITNRPAYGVDADATCATLDELGSMFVAVLGGHRVPNWECGCGFYALNTTPSPKAASGQVQLTVELSGVVVICEDGYRASHQRVVDIKAYCLLCHSTNMRFFPNGPRGGGWARQCADCVQGRPRLVQDPRLIGDGLTTQQILEQMWKDEGYG